MGSINPIGREPVSIPGSSKAKGSPRSAATAAKVSQIVQLPVVKQKGLQGRQITPLYLANDLSKKIQRDWDLFDPEELADKIIELEDRVAQLKESSPAVEKIKKQAEHLHFRFVFPVALELEANSGKAMPATFAKTVYNMAKQVFQTHSLHAFQNLSATQKHEVMRIASRGLS